MPAPRRRAVAVAAALLIVAPGSLPAEEPPAEGRDVREALEHGLELQRSDAYDAAIRELEAARSLASGDPSGDASIRCEILVELAETHFRKAKAATEGELEGADPGAALDIAARIFGEAAEEHEELLEHAPYAAYMIGSCSLLAGDMRRAFEGYKRAYFRYPEHRYGRKALLRLGVSLAGMGEAGKAREIFRTWLEQAEGDEGSERTAKKVERYISQLSLVDRPAPELDADGWLKGRVREGLPDLRGDVVVLVFFATWCEVCHRELPRIRRAVERWGDRGVLFVGVTDPDDPKVKEPVEFWVRRQEVGFFDVCLDRGGDSWHPYLVTGLPAAVIIDREGVVRWRGHFAFMGNTLLEELTGKSD